MTTAQFRVYGVPAASLVLLLLQAPAPAAAQTSNAYFEFLMARRLEALGDNAGALADGGASGHTMIACWPAPGARTANCTAITALRHRNSAGAEQIT